MGKTELITTVYRWLAERSLVASQRGLRNLDPLNSR